MADLLCRCVVGSQSEAFLDDDVAQSQWRLAVDDESHDVVTGWKRESQRPHRCLADRQWIASQLFAVARSLIVQSNMSWYSVESSSPLFFSCEETVKSSPAHGQLRTLNKKVAVKPPFWFQFGFRELPRL